MSATADEIKIDLDDLDAKAAAKADVKGAKDDDKAAITVETATEEAARVAKPIVTTEEGLEKLKKQLADEQLARADAERRAREAAEGEVKAKTEVQTSQLDLLTNAIATLTQANDALEAKYAEAMTAQDFAAAAKAQRDMSTNAAKLVRLEEGKTQLEKAPKPTVRAPADPVENFASQLTPQSAAWVRAHPEFVRDPRKNRQMLNAHQIAIDQGEAPDSEGYFSSIEHTLRITPRQETRHEPEAEALSDAARPKSARTAPPAAAPVSRSGNGAGSRPNVVRLTAEQREMAKLNNMTDEEYAREIVALRNEGKLN